MMRILKTAARTVFAGPAHYWLHSRAARRLGDDAKRRPALFAAFVEAAAAKRCLQIGARGRKFGPHWVSVDLYDRSDLVDHNYDVQDLPFESGSFDRVVCNAVLEHVPDPIRAISELHRVLADDGEIWVEVPFNQAFHSAPHDYWRVAPAGMRIWMRDFEERACGFFRIHRCSIHTAVYFHGVKRGHGGS